MRAPNPLERRPRGTAGRPAVPRPTSIVPYLRGVAAPRPQLSRYVVGLGDGESGLRPWLLDLALRTTWILHGADRGGPRVIREAGGRGRRGTTGLRVMVGAGLRAVGVQRRDAATADQRRDGRGPEGSGAGRTLAAVLRVRVALYQYPEADLYEAPRWTKASKLWCSRAPPRGPGLRCALRQFESTCVRQELRGTWARRSGGLVER